MLTFLSHIGCSCVLLVPGCASGCMLMQLAHFMDPQHHMLLSTIDQSICGCCAVLCHLLLLAYEYKLRLCSLQEAIDTCPVNCIHWVTASQLSLLEATMSKMERVAVWSLMSGGGGGRDVFTVSLLLGGHLYGHICYG